MARRVVPTATIQYEWPPRAEIHCQRCAGPRMRSRLQCWAHKTCRIFLIPRMCQVDWLNGYENAFPDKQPVPTSRAKWKKTRCWVLCTTAPSPPCVGPVRPRPTVIRTKRIVAMGLPPLHPRLPLLHAACPYGARSFNWSDPRDSGAGLDKEQPPQAFPTRMRGSCRKVQLLRGTAGPGELPACVTVASGAKAMYFGDLNDPIQNQAGAERRINVPAEAFLGTKQSVF